MFIVYKYCYEDCGKKQSNETVETTQDIKVEFNREVEPWKKA